MNPYIKYNSSIKVGSEVKIDGIDSKKIFEFNPIGVYPHNFKDLTLTVCEISRDRYGEMIKLDENIITFCWFSRYTLSLVDTPKHLDINKIKIDDLCIIGKEITDAPKLKTRNQLLRYNQNTAERYDFTESKILTDKRYKIIDIFFDDYIIIKDVEDTVEFIVPYWFLYSASYNLYEPKRIIRSFDNF